MASNKRTIHLGLDYSQFTGGVTEVNRKMSLLDAEFKRATQEAKNYGSASDQLALKQEYLTQKIALQNQKVEEAKKAYDAAINSQEASQKEIDELNRRYLDEQTRLEQLNGQLIETQRRTSGVDEANEKLNKTLKNVAIGITAAITAMAKFAVDTANTADELKTLSSQTGLTTTEIQRLQYAANFVDVEFETMSASITKLENNMRKSRDGSKELTEAFRKLHVKTTEANGEFRDANEVFYDVIDALGKVKNETELDTLAMEIFGKSAKELKPLIEQGSKALKDYGDEAERTGKIMSEDEVESAASFKDSMDRLNASLERIKQLLGEALMPIFEGIADFLGEIDVKTLLVISAVGGIIALLFKLGAAIGTVTTVMAAQTGVQMVFNATSLKTIVIILAIVAAIGLLVYAIAQLTGGTEKAKRNMQEIEDISAKTMDNVNKTTYSANSVGRNAGGTENWRGGKTWLGEEGPELVTLPAGSQITPASKVAAGTTIYNNYITIDAKNVQDFNRVVDLAVQQKMALRRT